MRKTGQRLLCFYKCLPVPPTLPGDQPYLHWFSEAVSRLPGRRPGVRKPHSAPCKLQLPARKSLAGASVRFIPGALLTAQHSRGAVSMVCPLVFIFGYFPTGKLEWSCSVSLHTPSAQKVHTYIKQSKPEYHQYSFDYDLLSDLILCISYERTAADHRH